MSLESTPKSKPLYRILSEAIRSQINEGQLKPGESLPTVREFARKFQVARSTVLKCYEDLTCQGLVETRLRSGTFVSASCAPNPMDFTPDLPTQNSDHEIKPLELSHFGNHFIDKEEVSVDFVSAEPYFGSPSLELLPMKSWKKCLLNSARLTDSLIHGYNVDPFGHKPFRGCLTDYLRRVRGVRCNTEQISIFSGAQLQFDLLCRLLINPGEFVGIENPGNPAIRRTLSMYGAKIVPFNVDHLGLVVDDVIASPVKLKFVYITPSYQEPLGTTLSTERRKKLLDWACKTNTLIIEDDVDCEYTYGSRPLTSLQGLDSDDCVIYLGSLWKVLGPLAQIGFVILPKRLVTPFREAKSSVDRHSPILEQYALTDFFKEGHFERHIHHTRQELSRRRQSLIFNLTMELGSRIRIGRATAGLRLLAKFNSSFSDLAIREAALHSSLGATSTDIYYCGQSAAGEYLIPFYIFDAEETKKRVHAFASELRDLSDQETARNKKHEEQGLEPFVHTFSENSIEVT